MLSRRRLWKETLVFLFVVLALPEMVSAQTPNCVSSGPSAGPSVSSPDGRYKVLKVFCSRQINERELALVLLDIKSGESRTLYTYDRNATVVWSPDSHWIAVNDYAGSDYTNNVVLSIDQGIQPINLKQLLFHSKLKQQILESDHLYLSASDWKSESEVQLVVWGHDSGARKAFCLCFLVSLKGTIRQCRFPIKGDDPESYCENAKKDAPPLATNLRPKP